MSHRSRTRLRCKHDFRNDTGVCRKCNKPFTTPPCVHCRKDAVVFDSGNFWCGRCFYEGTGDATYI